MSLLSAGRKTDKYCLIGRRRRLFCKIQPIKFEFAGLLNWFLCLMRLQHPLPVDPFSDGGIVGGNRFNLSAERNEMRKVDRFDFRGNCANCDSLL